MPAARCTITSTQSATASGSSTNETATIAAVAPSAIASARHSRRTANHSSPIPGVIFVSRTIDQAAGQRKPMTIATARSSETLPPAISIAVNGNSRPAASSRGPVRKRTAAMRSAVQTAMNACHGSAVSGETSWRNAGE